MNDDSLVEVFDTINPSEAHFLKDTLVAAGIQAVVMGDIIQTGGVQLPCPRVVVHQRDRQVADAIIAEWLLPTQGTAEPTQ